MTTTTIGSGVGSSLGMAPETTYGTFVAPTHFYEFDSESLEWKPNRTKGVGLYSGGLVARASQRATTTSAVTGGVTLSALNKQLGLLLAHGMGSTATPIQVGSSAAYTQTHTLGSNFGLSLSAQVGVPDTTGRVHQYNFSGLKVMDFSCDVKLDELVKMTFNFDGQNYQESSAFVVPTYTTPNSAFDWSEISFQIGTLGSEASVPAMGFSLSVKRSLASFYAMDASGLKQAPVQDAFYDITGTIDTTYIDKTKFVDLFASGVSQSIIVTCTGGLIAGSSSYTLKFALPCVFFEGETPKVGGPGLIQPSIPFSVDYNDSNVALTTTYISTDTSV